MMFRNYLSTFSAFLILVTCGMAGYHFYNSGSCQELHAGHDGPQSKAYKQGKKVGHPGWEKQYRMLKGLDEETLISADLARFIREAKLLSPNSSRAKRSASNLKNIKELGPSNIGGRTRALMIDRKNPDHLIAGGVSGGLWHSYNKGGTWQKVNDQATTLSVSAADQDFFDHDFMVYGSGEGSGNSSDVTGSGLFRSFDGGSAFELIPKTDSFIFSSVWDIHADPQNSGAFYVAANGVFYFENYGNNYSRVSDFGKYQDVEVLPDGKVFATKNGSGIYFSETGESGTFSRLTNGLPSSWTFSRVVIDYAPSDPSVLYAAFEETSGDGIAFVYKSADTGSTWTNISSNLVQWSYDFPWYCFVLKVSPTDPDLVYLGSKSLQYSVDGGNYWTPTDESHADHHSLAFTPSGDSVYVGNDGGIYRHNNAYNPQIYDDLNNNYNVTQFYAGSFFPKDDKYIGGTQDNGSLAKFYSFQHADHVFGGDGAYCFVSQQDPNISYVSYQYGNLYKATNTTGGDPNYSRIFSEPSGENAYFINPVYFDLNDHNRIYYVTRERVWASFNGGSFRELTSFLSGNPYAVGLTNKGIPRAYIGGSGGLFYRVDDPVSSNPGDEVNLSASLPLSLSADMISSITVHPDKDSVCFVSFSDVDQDPRVWRVDHAHTDTPDWKSVHGNLPGGLMVNYIDVDPKYPDSVFFAATDIGLFSTMDGGDNWTYEDLEIPHVQMFQVKVRPSDRRVFAFTHGRGVFAATSHIEDWDTTSDDPPIMVEKNSSGIPVEVYPNPVADHLYFSGGLEGEGVLKVYGLKGSLVQTMSVDLTKGISLSGLAPGVHFIRLSAGDKLITRKIVKSK